jgi:crotonobetainyl-CoA:carnitine CoA-transferase CaiB-like acyl-CoA transferase
MTGIPDVPVRHWAFAAGDGPPLAGLRVLDLSAWSPGPFFTQLLCDLGAHVIKVERAPGGDIQRSTVPAYFRALNRGKRSVALDLKLPADRLLASGLVDDADVLVEGFRPGVMDRLGLGPDDVWATNESLVYVSLSAFGDRTVAHDERGHETQFMARAGAFVDPTGRVYPPAPVPIGDLSAAMYAAVATIATLGRPDRCRVHLQVPIMGTALAWLFMRLLREVEMPGPRIEPGSGTFRARDGQSVSLSGVEPETWDALVRALDLDDVPDERTFFDRIPRAGEINDQIADRIAHRDRDEWLDVLGAEGIPVAPANDARAAFDDDVVRSMGVVSLEPTPHAVFPVGGLAASRHLSIPGLDDDGPAVRERGWEALDEPL